MGWKVFLNRYDSWPKSPCLAPRLKKRDIHKTKKEKISTFSFAHKDQCIFCVWKSKQGLQYLCSCLALRWKTLSIWMRKTYLRTLWNISWMSYMYLVIAKKYTEVIVKCALILKVTVNNSLEPVICINMSYMIIVGMCVSGKKKKKE